MLPPAIHTVLVVFAACFTTAGCVTRPPIQRRVFEPLKVERVPAEALTDALKSLHDKVDGIRQLPTTRPLAISLPATQPNSRLMTENTAERGHGSLQTRLLGRQHVVGMLTPRSVSLLKAIGEDIKSLQALADRAKVSRPSEVYVSSLYEDWQILVEAADAPAAEQEELLEEVARDLAAKLAFSAARLLDADLQPAVQALLTHDVSPAHELDVTFTCLSMTSLASAPSVRAQRAFDPIEVRVNVIPSPDRPNTYYWVWYARKGYAELRRSDKYLCFRRAAPPHAEGLLAPGVYHLEAKEGGVRPAELNTPIELSSQSGTIFDVPAPKDAKTVR